MSFDQALIAALTTRDADDDIEVNVADALMAIATALNRLAAVHERAQERLLLSQERFEALVASGGHGRPQ